MRLITSARCAVLFLHCQIYSPIKPLCLDEAIWILSLPHPSDRMNFFFRFTTILLLFNRIYLPKTGVDDADARKDTLKFHSLLDVFMTNEDMKCHVLSDVSVHSHRHISVNVCVHWTYCLMNDPQLCLMESHSRASNSLVDRQTRCVSCQSDKTKTRERALTWDLALLSRSPSIGRATLHVDE